MTLRKALSKKQRFDVFARDGFQCQYCGKTPPGVVLHVDHILAVAEGGTNEQVNLLTACESCNLGKGARPIQRPARQTVADRISALEEAERQLQAYRKVLLLESERGVRDFTVLERLYYNYRGEVPTKDDRESLHRWAHRWTIQEIGGALQLAYEKGLTGQDFMAYCGGIFRKWSALQTDRRGATDKKT